MACQRKHPVQNAFEYVLARPLRASLVVGSVINVTQIALRWAGLHFTFDVLYLSMLVPFIPPYFASRTARAVHERVGEHDFVRDALPYVFVAHPKDITLEALATCTPYMLSDSAAQHAGLSIETLLTLPVMPERFFKDARTQTKIFEHLITECEQKKYSKIRDHMLILTFGKTAQHYILNTVLKPYRSSFKWQGMLVRYEPNLDSQDLKGFH